MTAAADASFVVCERAGMIPQYLEVRKSIIAGNTEMKGLVEAVKAVPKEHYEAMDIAGQIRGLLAE